MLSREKRRSDVECPSLHYLKLVPSPQRPIVQISSRALCFQELACIKDSVIGLSPQVAIYLPMNLSSRPVSNKPLPAVPCWDNKKAWHGVNSILQALSPLQDPVERPTHVMRKRGFDARMQVNEVHRTRAGCGQNTKVVTLRKQSIKRSQRMRAGMIPTGNVGLDAETRFQPQGRNPIPRLRGNGPGTNVGWTEGADLLPNFMRLSSDTHVPVMCA